MVYKKGISFPLLTREKVSIIPQTPIKITIIGYVQIRSVSQATRCKVNGIKAAINKTKKVDLGTLEIWKYL